MKYVFFDTECASHVGGVAHICSIGYVICDSKYNILEKNDIVINPKCEFDSESFEKSGICLAYAEDYFRLQPDFSVIYPRVRELLTMSDAIFIGHSVFCDAAYLAQNMALYGLPYFDITYLDTQKMHVFFNGGEAPSLKKLCEIYNVPVLCEHKSDDDAEMTACVTKEICRANGVTLEELYENAALLGVLHEGVVHDDLSAAFPIGDGYRMTNSVKRVFRRYLSSPRLFVTPDPKFKGRCYCFDEEFECTCFCELLYVVDLLRRRGAQYTRNIPDCTVFVNFCGGKSGRYFTARRSRKKIISPEKLFEQLGIDREQLKSAAMKTDDILGSTEDSAKWLAYYNGHFKKQK